jgi:hypothetical protein
MENQSTGIQMELNNSHLKKGHNDTNVQIDQMFHFWFMVKKTSKSTIK